MLSMINVAAIKTPIVVLSNVTVKGDCYVETYIMCSCVCYFMFISFMFSLVDYFLILLLLLFVL